MQHLVSVPTRRSSLIARLFLGAALATAASVATAQAQIVVGTNVNMVGAPGYVDPVTGEIVNDPTLNRQNEPSHAFSTRNPCHLLAGSNDYSLVDFEIPLVGDERADAWLRVFKSFDCGRTWTSTPHPGHQLDLTAAGQASPIFGRQAAADATVRALPGGKFILSGLAFDRGGIAQVFVSLFEDRNNKDGGDSIDWLGTTVIDTGTSGQFLDKPWLATTATGQAYLAYTVFLGSGNNIHTKIMVTRFNGTTWSGADKVSDGGAKNQGATIAVDPGTGYVYIAFREFTSPRDSIMVLRSTNGGNSYSSPTRVEPLNASGQPYQLKPFDQDASFVTFRTFTYPTIAIMPAVAEGRPANQPGRVYLAWAARGFVPLRNNQMPGQTSNQTRGDTRIVYSTSLDGTTWTYPKPADNSADAGHQLMPALASSGGKLALAYYDLRADASLTFDDNVVEYGQAALDSCMAQSIGVVGFNVVQCMIALPSVVAQRRHTLDVRAAVADGACLVSGACNLSSVSALNGNRRVSRYLRAYTGPSQGLVQLQYNAPNLPLFKKGSRAFIGDYIEIQGLDYVPNGSGGWAWNTGANAGSPAALFMVTWADNRNVRRPGSAGWERFTRINSAACEPGKAGIRNQDVYSAVLRSGLSVTAPLNARRIGDLQRSFPIVVANNTDQPRNYHASVNAPANVVASFDQFAGFGFGLPLISLDLAIPPRSTATRTLFVLKTDGAEANVLVPVLVAEVGGTGQTDTVFLNPDLSNPDAADASVGSAEFHVPVLGAPSIQTFTNTPDIKTPDFETPDFETPDFETPDFETPDFETPTFVTPDFETPDFETPDFETPDFETPDFETAAVADVSWKVTNIGNVTSAYKPNINIQDSKIGTRYQLVVRTVTVQSLTSALSCKPGLLPQNQMLVNIVDPHVQSPLVGLTSTNFNDPDPKNATFTLGSNQSAVITLRAYCNANAPGANGLGGCAAEGPLPRELDAAGHPTGRPLVSTSSVAQAANCQRCTGGSCNLADFVGGGTVCALDDGLPKDIYDPIPPVFGSAPAPTADDTNNSGDEPMTFVLSVTDNVLVTSVACTDGAVTPGSPGSYSVSGTFPVGTTPVTCNAADGSGNHSELNFNVVVRDITPPAFNIAPNPGAPFGPGNPAEASGPGGAAVTYTNPSASDSNGGPVQVTCASIGGLVSGSTFPIGTTDINCTATDESGVSTPPSNLFDITVADRTPPVITITGAPAATVEAGVTGGAIVTFGSSALDSVSGATASTCSPASGSVFPLGTTTVICSSTDGAGNAGSTTFAVTVADTTPPVMPAIANVIAEATGPTGAAVTYSNPTATDTVDASVAVSCVAPSASTRARLISGASSGMTTVARIPSSRAARATP